MNGDGSSHSSTAVECEMCGEMVNTDAISDEIADVGFVCKFPTNWQSLSEDLNKQMEKDGELCSFTDDEGTHYFVLGTVKLALQASDGSVHNRNKCCPVAVWVSVNEDNYKRMLDAWDSTTRSQQPPFFGWVMNELPGVGESTLFLKCRVHVQPPYQRPFIELQPTEHLLSKYQRLGMSTAQYIHFVHALLQSRVT